MEQARMANAAIHNLAVGRDVIVTWRGRRWYVLSVDSVNYTFGLYRDGAMDTVRWDEVSG